MGAKEVDVVADGHYCGPDTQTDLALGAYPKRHLSTCERNVRFGQLNGTYRDAMRAIQNSELLHLLRKLCTAFTDTLTTSGPSASLPQTTPRQRED